MRQVVEFCQCGHGAHNHRDFIQGPKECLQCLCKQYVYDQAETDRRDEAFRAWQQAKREVWAQWRTKTEVAEDKKREDENEG